MRLSRASLVGPGRRRQGGEPARGVVPGSPLFREEVVSAYLRGDAEGRLLRATTPRTLSLFACLSSLVVLVFALTASIHVETTSRGRGILRASGGVQVVLAEVPGVVAAVFVHSGQRVEKDEPLFRIDSAATRAGLLEADRRLATLTEGLGLVTGEMGALYQEQLATLEAREKILARLLASQAGTVKRFRSRAQAATALNQKGYVGVAETAVADEEVARANRSRLSYEQDRAALKQQIVSMKTERAATLLRWRQDRATAQASRDALAVASQQMTIAAPMSGVVDGITARLGDVVAAGAPVAKVVPTAPASEIAAFITEKDRAFIEPGALVRVEVEQLPVGEFGALTGRILRVGSDLASAQEVKNALGEAVPLSGANYEARLSVVPDAQSDRLAPWLRPGTLVSVRYTLRKRRLIAVLFQPLRKWLD